MMAYHPCELWDTALSAQSLETSGSVEQFRTMAERAYRFIDENQVRCDVSQRARHYRDPSRGGWPFSNRAQGWPVVDCTAEGLIAALALQPYAERPIPEAR